MPGSGTSCQDFCSLPWETIAFMVRSLSAVHTKQARRAGAGGLGPVGAVPDPFRPLPTAERGGGVQEGPPLRREEARQRTSPPGAPARTVVPLAVLITSVVDTGVL